MKILKASAICVLFSICYFSSSAQDELPLNEPDYNKPHLFSDMPQKMKLRISNLEDLLDLPVGASVKTLITDNFNFHGIVVSTSDAANTTVKSVVIRSTNRKGATLTFTKTIKPDGTVKYLGRIMSLKNGDAFEIVKENDQYILQKKILYDLINE
jgi:hypothetical protein